MDGKERAGLNLKDEGNEENQTASVGIGYCKARRAQNSSRDDAMLFLYFVNKTRKLTVSFCRATPNTYIYTNEQPPCERARFVPAIRQKAAVPQRRAKTPTVISVSPSQPPQKAVWSKKRKQDPNCFE